MAATRQMNAFCERDFNLLRQEEEPILELIDIGGSTGVYRYIVA